MTTNSKKTKINNYPHVVSFRLDDEALAALSRAGEAHGLTHHAYARTLALRGAGVQAKLPEVKVRTFAADALRALHVEQVRQGNNLNQIAMRVNQGDRSLLAALAAWFAASNELMQRITDALGTTRDP